MNNQHQLVQFSIQMPKCKLTLNGWTPSKQIIPTQMQVDNGFISGNIHRAFKSAGDSIVLINSFFISGRIPLDLLCPLAYVVEVLDADSAIIIMDAGHDIVTTLAWNIMKKKVSLLQISLLKKRFSLSCLAVD